MRGTTVADRYRLVDAIGSGGMGEVWSADDLQEGHRVALKIIKLDEGGAVREAAFRREIGVAQRLSHPHVVTVHDHGAADVGGRRTLVHARDRVNGPPLSDLTTGPLSLADTLTWATQISQALLAAHQAGIAHRDVKASNILIDHRRTALLCDFGIARLTDTTSHTLTVTGAPSAPPPTWPPNRSAATRTRAPPATCTRWAA
ncbi:serine/threonine-protein kinase [Streptomyces sp. XH2]|uniref:serine/threonine-protein kinase n=1 Tax=Streptomyces sp. XH2 TaxID=3412483 RepID=UPI003C7CDFFD